nr:hypothetical protein [Desulfuromonas sp. CSMB_57]
MSEYQYLEFLAVDRPLTAREMDHLRGISTRAQITPVSFINEYSWGGLKADPRDFIRRFFDVHVYRDHLWSLGGTIIREVSLYEEYQDDPLEKLRESVADDGILPDHYDQMTQAELKAFERMCRRFEKYLGERK